MIKFHDGLNTAQQITEKIMNDIRILVTAMEMSVTTYHNGREIGHAITYNKLDKTYRKAICYSTSRGSDQIVVYLDSDYNYLPIVSEYSYDNKKFFSEGDINGATEYIIQKILADDKEYIKNYEEMMKE